MFTLSCSRAEIRLESKGILNESPRLRTLAYDPRVGLGPGVLQAPLPLRWLFCWVVRCSCAAVLVYDCYNNCTYQWKGIDLSAARVQLSPLTDNSRNTRAAEGMQASQLSACCSCATVFDENRYNGRTYQQKSTDVSAARALLSR